MKTPWTEESHAAPHPAHRGLGRGGNEAAHRIKCVGARAALLLAIACTHSGCITLRNYEFARPGDTQPAMRFTLSASPSPGDAAAPCPIEASLRSVIVFRGPGSWKREAYWDEYVVSITNHGAQPLTLETVILTDFEGASSQPFADPLALEDASVAAWRKWKSRSFESQLALGAGATAAATTLARGSAASDSRPTPGVTAGDALAGAAATTLVAAPIYAGGTALTSLASGGVLGSASTAAAGAATVSLVALPLATATAVVLTHNLKAKMVAEFERRRLPLPLTLAPGATADGSLFFRISPGPTRLTLRGRTDTQSYGLLMDLTPLSGLHLRPENSQPPGPTSAAPQP